MKSLSRNEKIAVGVGVVIFIFVLFPSISFFSTKIQSLFLGEDELVVQGEEREEAINREEIMEEIQNTEGLEVTVLEEGEGKVAVSGSLVAVHYVGTLADNTLFDASYLRGEPIQFVLGTGAVIAGWDKGLLGMREGEKRRIVISPELAYGNDPAAHQLGGQTLIFEVTMEEVTEGQSPTLETGA